MRNHEKIRELKAIAGLTDSEIGHALGYNSNTIARKMRGEMPVTNEMVQKVKKLSKFKCMEMVKDLLDFQGEGEE